MGECGMENRKRTHRCSPKHSPFPIQSFPISLVLVSRSVIAQGGHALHHLPHPL
jgi:hypothetical protein